MILNKIFLVFLFVAITTFCNAQQVTISSHTARFFLEQKDRAERLQEENTLLKSAFAHLDSAFSIQRLENEKLAEEKSIEHDRVVAAQKETQDERDTNKMLRKQIKREKFQKVVIVVGSVVIIILVAI